MHSFETVLKAYNIPLRLPDLRSRRYTFYERGDLPCCQTVEN